MNHKGKLQELLQKLKKTLPKYEYDYNSGRKEYKSNLLLNGVIVLTGDWKSNKIEADQDVAEKYMKELLKKINKDEIKYNPFMNFQKGYLIILGLTRLNDNKTTRSFITNIFIHSSYLNTLNKTYKQEYYKWLDGASYINNEMNTECFKILGNYIIKMKKNFSYN